MGVLIIKNISREGPGLIEEVLKHHRIQYAIVDLDKEEPIPDISKFDALIVMGGPDSANDRTLKMQVELDKVSEAVERGMPILGICLGMQVLVKACGGEVVKARSPEIGWKDSEGKFFEIEFTPEGAVDPLFLDLAPPLRIFHLHGETVNLPGSIDLLAFGHGCKNQVVRIGRSAYGLQGHLELTEQMFRTWAAEDPDLQKLPAKQLQEDYRKIRGEYEKTGRKMIENFLKVARLI